ncbi:MAG: co-chaperone GroES [bacterium]
MKFKPLGDKVLVEPAKEKERSSSGIIIPDTAKEKPQEGKVIAVGSGKRDDSGKLIPMDVKVGDKVIYGKYAGTEIKLEGKDYVIVDQSDISGILE